MHTELMPSETPHPDEERALAHLPRALAAAAAHVGLTPTELGRRLLGAAEGQHGGTAWRAGERVLTEGPPSAARLRRLAVALGVDLVFRADGRVQVLRKGAP